MLEAAKGDLQQKRDRSIDDSIFRDKEKLAILKFTYCYVLFILHFFLCCNYLSIISFSQI